MHRPILVLASAVLVAACSPSADEFEPREESEASAHPGGATYRWQQRLNEDGRIPHNAMVIAKGQRDAVIRRAATEDAAPPLISNWTWRGPGNVGGRIRGILIHPTNTNTMWIGSASGGVWMTTNGGGSWSPLNDFLPSLTIGCMAMDPADPTKLYVGTGEGFFNTVQGSTNTAAIQGAGIFVSTDSGAHWNQLPATATPGFYFVNRIAIDPNNSQIILAATGTGIWRTTDAGASWSQRTTLRALDLEFHPTDSMKAVAGGTTGFSQFSTDGGQSWTHSSGFGVNATRAEIAYARSDPDIVYASVTDTAERIRIWRSTNGGQNFVRRTPDNPSDFDGITYLSLYTNALWVDPTNPDRLLFAGVRIYSSIDGGINWLGRNGNTHSDHHIIVEHPNFNGANNLTVFEGNDGGIYRRDAPFVDSNWLELKNNLGITQFYGGAVNPTSGVIIGGTQDNGTLRWNGNTETWSRQIGGDGGFCAADPTDPNVFYGETQRLIIRRSTDGGFSFSDISNGIGDAGNSSRVNFIPYFMLDPNESNRMLAAGRELWRSNNVRTGNPPTWSSIKSPIGCTTDSVVPQGHYNLNSECNISTIAVAQGNPDIIWVGHNNGRLFKTTNGTAVTPTWRATGLVSGLLRLTNRWVSRIVIDPRDHDRVYVSFLGYRDDSIWRTVDGGQNWVEISGSGATGIPEIPVASFAVHPRMSGALFAGTDLGLFISIDDGNSWMTSDDGPGGVAIDELVWKNDLTLLVVTHGRGIYEVDTQVQLASHRFVGLGCGMSGIPTLTSDEPIIGATQTYNVRGVFPNALYAFAYGPSGSPTDFGNGCFAQPDLQNTTLVFLGQTTASGTGTVAVPIPLDSSLIGAVLITQVLVDAPGGPLLGTAELTNGLAQSLGF